MIWGGIFFSLLRWGCLFKTRVATLGNSTELLLNGITDKQYSLPSLSVNKSTYYSRYISTKQNVVKIDLTLVFPVISQMKQKVNILFDYVSSVKIHDVNQLSIYV